MTALRNIVILRALGGVGDVLAAIPAIAALRAAHGEARITYVGLPQVEGVVARYAQIIDRFVAFPGFPGIPEHPFDARRLHDFLESWRCGPQPDLVVQMHGSGSVSNVFAALLNGKRTAGYCLPGLWRPDDRDYSHFPDTLSEVERWSKLVARLGCAPVAAPGFPISPEEHTVRDDLRLETGGRPYAVIHAGASDPARRWPAARFAVVADHLAGHGVTPVLTGVASERATVASVRAAMRHRSVDLCGETTLGEMAALIEGAALTVTNDTGTSHLAASLQAPSVVLFIASDPARWAPAARQRHVAVGAGVPDIPAGVMRARAHASFPEVDEVIDAIDRQLAQVAA